MMNRGGLGTLILTHGFSILQDLEPPYCSVGGCGLLKGVVNAIGAPRGPEFYITPGLSEARRPRNNRRV
jgi:hypothetical protein